MLVCTAVPAMHQLTWKVALAVVEGEMTFSHQKPAVLADHQVKCDWLLVWRAASMRLP